MTKTKELEYDEFGPKPIPENDYLDPEYARRAKIRRAGGGKPKERTPAQKQQRKIFFINQAKKAKAAGKSIADYLSGSKQVPVSTTPRESPAPSTGRPAHGKHTISESESDPDEGPAPKQKPTSDFAGGDSDAEMAAAAEEMEGMDTEFSQAQARSGAADGAGGAGGGGGVGESTGNWSCEINFHGNGATTTASRHCLCVPRNSHAYKMIGQSGQQSAETKYLGMSTPWNYFDFNEMDIFFSPHAMQTLVNKAKRWRPKGYRVDVFNIQIIQKQVGANNTIQYVNDLTSTIQIFADDTRMYPIIGYPNQTTIMSPFPSDVYRLPQYAYIFDHDNTAATSSYPSNWAKMLTSYSKFYVLDQHESAMLRTGNCWSTSFSFGDIGWFENRRLVQPINRMMNPLYDTWQTTTQNGNAEPKKFGVWKQPFLPGPYVCQGRGNNNNTLPNQWPEATMENGMVPAVPGPPTGPITTAGTGDNTSGHYTAFNFPRWTKGVLINNPGQSGTAPGDQADYTGGLQGTYVMKGSLAKINKNSNPSAPFKGFAVAETNTASTAAISYQGVIPGMVWDKRPVHSRMAIWQRVPNTESGFEPGSELGGLPTRKPPGHIFVRVTPKPLDTAGTAADNDTGQMGDIGYINQFATFTVKVTMEWEIDWDDDHSSWNPKDLFAWNSDSARANGSYWVNHEGTYVMDHVIVGKQLSKFN